MAAGAATTWESTARSKRTNNAPEKRITTTIQTTMINNSTLTLFPHFPMMSNTLTLKMKTPTLIILKPHQMLLLVSHPNSHFINNLFRYYTYITPLFMFLFYIVDFLHFSDCVLVIHLFLIFILWYYALVFTAVTIVKWCCLSLRMIITMNEEFQNFVYTQYGSSLFRLELVKVVVRCGMPKLFLLNLLLLLAVTERGYKLSEEVLPNVCRWEGIPSSSRRFLWHCTS